MNDKIRDPVIWRREHFVLHSHRSLGTQGFAILMGFVGLISFVTGVVFALIGAWPVLAFFGLDVLLVYVAFRLNYRSGRLYETVDVSPDALKLTRVHPSGRREEYEFNPFWVRVRLSEWPDGRTTLRLATRERELLFGNFLTDDERRQIADVLSGALVEARGSRV